MTHCSTGARARVSRRIAGLCGLAVLLALAGCSQSIQVGANGLPMSAADPRAASAFVKPADLAATLAGEGEKPVLLHVGFRALYRGGAIPGTHYVGPGQTAEGIASLKAAVTDLPRDRAIVIYCGCCPWNHCPNMRPAYALLKEMGFTNMRALYTPKNLETDWADLGFPLERPGN